MVNTFYGKPINQLSANELRLLCMDLQLTALMKGGEEKLPEIGMVTKGRTILVNKVMKEGGEYSRSQFVEENNLPQDDQFLLGEAKRFVKELDGMMKELGGLIKGVIKDSIEGKHGNESDFKIDKLNGKEENGMQMN